MKWFSSRWIAEDCGPRTQLVIDMAQRKGFTTWQASSVGYGDMVPTTLAGRLLGGAVSIIGIGTLALFSGLITVGFLDQLKIHRERTAAMHAGDAFGAAMLAGSVRAHGKARHLAEPRRRR